MLSRLIDAVVCINKYLFLFPSKIPLFVYTTFYLSIHLLMVIFEPCFGYYGECFYEILRITFYMDTCFNFSWVYNLSIFNFSWVQVFIWTYVLISLEWNCLVIWKLYVGLFRLFSKAVSPLYIIISYTCSPFFPLCI